MVQPDAGAPPPLLKLRQLVLQQRLRLGISREEQLPSCLHRQDVAALLPLQHPLLQLGGDKEQEV